MPSTYKRDKPWDTDDIDKWKVRYITQIQNIETLEPNRN